MLEIERGSELWEHMQDRKRRETAEGTAVTPRASQAQVAKTP